MVSPGSSPVGSLRMFITALPLTVRNPSGLWHHWKLHTNFHFLLLFSAFSPAHNWSLRFWQCIGLTLLGLPSPWNFDHASSGLLGILKLRLPFLFFCYSFLGNKVTQKDNADSGVQFITPAGPRQSLLLAKDPDQRLWKSFISHVYVSKPTNLIPLRIT